MKGAKSGTYRWGLVGFHFGGGGGNRPILANFSTAVLEDSVRK